MPQGCDPHRLVLQEIAQRIDAMYADVGNRASSSYRPVVDPGAPVSAPDKRELGAGKYGTSDFAGRDVLPEPGDTLRKTKNLSDAQQNARFARRFDHLAAFAGVHAHRLFAEHRLTVPHRRQNVVEVTCVRTGNKDSIHVRAPTQVFR